MRTAVSVSMALAALSGCGLMLDLDPSADDAGGIPTLDAGPRLDSGRTRVDAGSRQDGAIAREGGPDPVVDAGSPIGRDASPIPTTDAGGPMRIDGATAGTGHFGDPCAVNSDCASGLCRIYDDPPFCWYQACTATCGDDTICTRLLEDLGLVGGLCVAGECDLTRLGLGTRYCE